MIADQSKNKSIIKIYSKGAQNRAKYYSIVMFLLIFLLSSCSVHLIDRNNEDFKINFPADDNYNRLEKYLKKNKDVSINNRCTDVLDIKSDYQIVRADNFRSTMDTSENMVIIFLNPNCSYADDILRSYERLKSEYTNLFLLSMSNDIERIQSLKSRYAVYNQKPSYIISHHYDGRMIFNVRNFIKDLSPLSYDLYKDELCFIDAIKFDRDSTPKIYFDIDSLVFNSTNK